MADAAEQANKPSLTIVAPETPQPQNLEAEQGLLGALMVNNRIYERVSEFLRADHFYDPAHQAIYGAMAALLDRGDPVSPISLRPFFEHDAGMARKGGAEYLVKLAASAASSINSEVYARTIEALAARRELIRTSQEMYERATRVDINDPPDKQIESAEQRLYDIGERREREGFADFNTTLSEVVKIADEARQSPGFISGLATGLGDLDRLLGGLHKSDLVIIAGRPGMGKTALGANIAFNAARAWRGERGADGRMQTQSGAITGFYSLEMSSAQLSARLVAAHAQLEIGDTRKGQFNDEKFARLQTAAREIDAIPLYIDETGAIPLPRLAARARRLKRQRGLDLLVIDYLQLVTTGAARGFENRVQEVSQISRGLKALAKELDIPIIALSQLSRQVESRDDKRPQLADLRESGSIEQDADVVMFIYREHYYLQHAKPPEGTPEYEKWRAKIEENQNKAELIISKNRHGPPGNIDVYFASRYTRFSDLQSGAEPDMPEPPPEFDDVPD